MSTSFEYIVQNQFGNILNLTDVMAETMKVPNPSFAPEGDYVEKADEHGTVFRGNGRIGKREITLKFDHVASRPIDYEYALNEIAAFFSEPEIDGPYWLVNTTRKKRIKIMLKNFDPKTNDGLENVIGMDNTMTFVLLGGLWEMDPVTEVFLLSSGEIKEINFPRIAFPTHVIMEMESLGPNPDFAIDFGTIVNSEFIGRQSVRYQQSSLVAGQSLIHDSVDGIIYYKRDGITFPNNLILTAGTPGLVLKRGLNGIRFQGLATIKFKLTYRTRVAF
ncbi:hypothetical protein [Leptospira perdikensis]|uniref:Phage tail protein n=2 Tax=Leptospira TaxID=171 RepID=A0A4R9J9W1_9LEPT|nr:hypothetical protein [Leptospira perdikensis]TGL35606.1 hypothetical protein EHQ49_17675 [Leptospira perdikensis]